jgi:hypothetical protein
MREYLKSHIDRRWADPAELRTVEVEKTATEQVCRPEFAVRRPPDRGPFPDYLEINGIVGYGSRSSTD